MRLIVIDIGNTSTAVGLWAGGRVTRVTHADGRDRAAAVAAAEALLAAGRIDGLARASVVPRRNAAWRRFARAAGRPLVAVDHALFRRVSGVGLDYPRPETIGADRLADAAAAVARYGAPVTVCDFGTAFTAAVVTADGVWRGGAIAPGFPLMRDYLFERTAQLPRLELGARCPAIGRSTEEAMAFGACVGYRGMAREIVETLERNCGGGPFRRVATGGWAKWALQGAGLGFTIDPTLTLRGIGLLAKEALR